MGSLKSVAQSRLLRFTDDSIEGRYRLFIQPRVPSTIAAIYFSAMLVVLLGDLFSFQAIGSGTYAEYVTVFQIVISTTCSVMQMVLALFDRKGLLPRLHLLTVSDGLLFTMGFVTIVTEVAVMLREWGRDCEGLTFFVQQPGKVYRYHNCQSVLLPHGISMGFLMVFRRMRFHVVLGYSLLCFAHNIIVAALNHAVLGVVRPELLYIHAVYNLGFLLFAAWNRYNVEPNERQHTLLCMELEEQLEAIQSRSADLHEFVSRLLPDEIVRRSSHRRLNSELDTTSSGVVCVITTYDAEKEFANRTPAQAVAILETSFSHLEEKAQQYRLHRIRVTADELFFVGNLIDKFSSVQALTVGAASVALSAVELKAGGDRVPFRACVGVGSLRGLFVGKSWIQYHVSGQAIDVARAVLQHAGLHEVLLTDECHQLIREHVSVSDGPEVEHRTDHVSTFHLQCVETTSISDTNPLTLVIAGERLPNEDDKSRSTPSLDALPQLLALQRDLAHLSDEKFPMVTVWRFFKEFKSASHESEFLHRRMQTMAKRGVAVWLGFAFLQGVFVLLLLADWWELASSYAALGLFLTVTGASLLIAAVPASVSPSEFERYHTLWSGVGLFVPLLSMLAAALSRPSAIGQVPSPFAIAAAIVRTPCFVHAKYQLVVIPLLLIISQSQAVLPGGSMDNAVPFTWFLVLYSVATDSENDAVQRDNFVVERRLGETLRQLTEERRVREGLLRSAFPAPVVQAWLAGMLPESIMQCILPDTLTAVVHCDRLREDDPCTPRSVTTVQRIMDEFWTHVEGGANRSGLVVVRMSGDTVVLASSLSVDGSVPEVWFLDENAASCIVDGLAALCSSGDVQVLVDSDTSVQLIGNNAVPTFSFSGVVLSRLLALQGIGFGGNGLYLTERLLQVVRPEIVGYREVPQPPVRVRGVGIVRMVKMLQSDSK